MPECSTFGDAKITSGAQACLPDPVVTSPVLPSLDAQRQIPDFTRAAKRRLSGSVVSSAPICSGSSVKNDVPYLVPFEYRSYRKKG